MQAWAESVKVDGAYLEFTDLFLVASAHGMGLKLVTYAHGQLGWGWLCSHKFVSGTHEI